jgi:hypothetical protein
LRGMVLSLRALVSQSRTSLAGTISPELERV